MDIGSCNIFFHPIESIKQAVFSFLSSLPLKSVSPAPYRKGSAFWACESTKGRAILAPGWPCFSYSFSRGEDRGGSKGHVALLPWTPSGTAVPASYWFSVFPATVDAAMFAVRAAAASRPVFSGCVPWLRSGGQQLLSLASFHGSAQRPKAKVAVILSGSGVYDGTEIHEASAILVHLSREGAEVKMYAPDVPQLHVIDHTKGQPIENEKRNVLVESARIARGKVTDLSKLNSKDYDAVIFPGGFGVAKNLCTFAIDGKDCKVNKDVERILSQFHKEGKPIGLCCISPILAAKVIQGTEVTVGHEQEEEGKWPYCGTAEAIKALGAKHCVKEVTEAHVDTKNKVVTTPAFMCETALHHIFDGIGLMVRNVLKLTNK